MQPEEVVCGGENVDLTKINATTRTDFDFGGTKPFKQLIHSVTKRSGSWKCMVLYGG